MPDMICPACGRRRSKSAGCPDTCAEKSARIFTDDQVASMNAYQVAGVMHPFTCGHVDHSTELVAYPEGWRCPITGELVQGWAHTFMTDWSWTSMDCFGRTWNKEKGGWE